MKVRPVVALRQEAAAVVPVKPGLRTCGVAKVCIPATACPEAALHLNGNVTCPAPTISPPAATFPVARCISGMKTFLKILLVAFLLVVALKLSPLLFLAAFIGLIGAVVLGAVGFSLVAALLAVAIAFAVALSPIWIPVLVVMGLISLFKKDARTPPPVAA